MIWKSYNQQRKKAHGVKSSRRQDMALDLIRWALAKGHVVFLMFYVPVWLKTDKNERKV